MMISKKDNITTVDMSNDISIKVYQSLYQDAIEQGFLGEFDEFLALFKGEKGEPGLDGADGQDGRDGENGKDGQDGKDGQNGQDGATFTPNIENGVLSWRNNAGLENPKPLALTTRTKPTDFLSLYQLAKI